jgi:hypothetical protein
MLFGQSRQINMVYAKQVFADELLQAMPIYGTKKYLCAFVYCNNDKYVGGAYLIADYPNKLVMEFYENSPTIINAIAESFRGFLNIKDVLIAEIEKTNFKSLKMAKQIGFKKIRSCNNIVHVQFNKEFWRYQKRHPIK